MPDPRIPEDLILRVSRSVGEIEDVREQASEDLKVTWADMREELKALGLNGKEVSSEVGFLKAAIAETRKSAEDHAKAETKADGVAGYLEILNSPRARARAHARKEPQSAPQAAQDDEQEKSVSSAPGSAIGSEDSASDAGRASSKPIQPETANEIHESPSNRDVSTDGEASPLAGPQAKASPTAREQEAGTLAGHEGRSEGEAGSSDLPTNSNSVGTEPPSPPADGESDWPTTGALPENSPATVTSGEAQATAAATGASPVIRAAGDTGAQPAGGEDETAPESGAHGSTTGKPGPASAGPALALNPNCLKAREGAECKFAHKSYSCWECNSAAAAARQRKAAA